MSNYPDNLKYAKSHEWIRIDGDIATVGISDHAQQALGDIVFVELPAVGDTKGVSDEAAVVESVKAASDVYSPLSGEITEINENLQDTPDKVNASPYDDGWFFRIRLSNPSELDDLLDAKAYADLCSEE